MSRTYTNSNGNHYEQRQSIGKGITRKSGKACEVCGNDGARMSIATGAQKLAVCNVCCEDVTLFRNNTENLPKRVDVYYPIR